MSEVLLHKPSGIMQWLYVYRLYRSAFPASERKPFGIILKMHSRGKTDVWCVERDGQFTGLATTINGDDLILLDYFAVTKACRGEGIGSAAMGELQRIYADRGLFVEIESTRENAVNQEQREKRKRFYQAAGMEELHVHANVFGVNMELLGSRCQMDFERYREFYREHYSAWAAQQINKGGV